MTFTDEEVREWERNRVIDSSAIDVGGWLLVYARLPPEADGIVFLSTGTEDECIRQAMEVEIAAERAAEKAAREEV